MKGREAPLPCGPPHFISPFVFYRLSCAAVVGFWLVMTVLLINRSYFSSEDRLPVVKNPDEVIERFITHPNSSNLNVYRDREVVGSLSITPRQLSNGNRDLLMNALGKIDFPGVGKQDVAWQGKLELTPGHEVAKFELTVKFRNPRMKVGLEFDPQTFDIRYRVEHGGEVLIDSADEESKAVKRVKFLLAAWGLSPKALKSKGQGRESLARDDAIVARFGRVVIGGERQTAYILDVAPMRGRRFKLYFSEAGELLKIGNVLGYEILSEGFNQTGSGGGNSDD
jgi:hypothetical protein